MLIRTPLLELEPALLMNSMHRALHGLITVVNTPMCAGKNGYSRVGVVSKRGIYNVRGGSRIRSGPGANPAPTVPRVKSNENVTERGW